jgi:peptidylprolyl isomerase
MNNLFKKKPIAIFLILVLLVLFTIFVIKMVDNISPSKENTKVKIETSEGDIIIELYNDMPVTAGNFQKLVSNGYYDGVVFHRIIPNFMIQGGDPTGTGAGGPGYVIKDEFVKGHSNIRGTISMANSGPNSGGSQFFINLVDNSFLDFDKEPLSSKHPVFGEVIEGIDVVDKISSVKTGVGDKPVVEVKILKASVI